MRSIAPYDPDLADIGLIEPVLATVYYDETRPGQWYDVGGEPEYLENRETCFVPFGRRPLPRRAIVWRTTP